MIIKSLYFAPAVVWAAIIYGLSTTSSANLPKFDLLSADKIGHLVFYTGLIFWLLWALRKNAGQSLGATLAALAVAGGMARLWSLCRPICPTVHLTMRICWLILLVVCWAGCFLIGFGGFRNIFFRFF